jgi:hypothetical protein
MTLNAIPLKWAIDFVATHPDSDLFPKVLEIEAIQALRDDFVKLIEGKDLSSFAVRAHRRFIVPQGQSLVYDAVRMHFRRPALERVGGMADVLTLPRRNIILRESAERGGSRHGHEDHYGAYPGRARRASLGGCPAVPSPG